MNRTIIIVRAAAVVAFVAIFSMGVTPPPDAYTETAVRALLLAMWFGAGVFVGHSARQLRSPTQTHEY